MTGNDAVWLLGDSQNNLMLINAQVRMAYRTALHCCTRNCNRNADRKCCDQLVLDRVTADRIRKVVHDRCAVLYPRLQQRVVYAEYVSSTPSLHHICC